MGAMIQSKLSIVQLILRRIFGLLGLWIDSRLKVGSPQVKKIQEKKPYGHWH